MDAMPFETATVVPYPADLRLDGVRLRPYRDSDATSLHVAVRESLATVGHWQPWCNEGFNLSSAEAWIAYCKRSWLLGDHFEFAVVDDATDEYLGGTGINQRNREHRFANLGYWVRQSRQGYGIATKSGRLAARFGFANADLSRIEVVVAEGNLASRRTAEKIGARLESIARNRLVLHGVPVNAAMYSLVPDDAL
jgi:ribosomal-protein-serine acetyltransferase